MNSETTTTLLIAFIGALVFGLGAMVLAWRSPRPPRFTLPSAETADLRGATGGSGRNHGGYLSTSAVSPPEAPR